MPTAKASSRKIVVSVPPVGKKRVKNIYWDITTEELVFDIED